ncbi:MAG TPA: dTMP kinase [Micavibrio sp.]|jgi:dTMP kinase
MAIKGFFITLEGGEGTGKTTQIKNLAATLAKKGHEVVITREPGGTPDAEKIRNLLVRQDGGDWTPMTECLLLFAARVMHVEKLIRPAIEAGKIVICDRFTDSTRAYQSYGHGVDLSAIDEIDRIALRGFKPDITFILDLPVEKGLERAGQRLRRLSSTEDKFERLDPAFHQRLRQGFLEIAGREPGRCIVLNANRAINDIALDLSRHVLEKVQVNAVR